MKESFIDLSTLIGQTQPLKDMELQSYLASIGSTEFTVTNIPATLQAVSSAKEDSALDSVSDYIVGTKYQSTLSDDIDSLMLTKISESDKNTELIGRQYEINEWANENKLDTLFFMQVLFISLTFISMMLFLKNQGILHMNAFLFLSCVAGGIALLILVLRSRYTNTTRNSRYWHKARFGSAPNPFPTTVTPKIPKCQ